MRYLTAGESHGRGLVGIIEGIPAGLPLALSDLDPDLKRRKMGYGRGNRQKIESDAVEFIAGVRHGLTLGSPIALTLWNQDWRNWTDVMQAEPASGPVRRRVTVPRPGHADLVGGIKYAHDDMRNVLERSSARETAMRVALGAIARRFLAAIGVDIASRVVRVGKVEDATVYDGPVAELNILSDASPVRALDGEAEAGMIAEIEAVKKAGDTVGGIFEVQASGVPVGLGSYSQWDRRLEGEIAKAFLSLNAIKGVEMGIGFGAASLRGSAVHDSYVPGTGNGRRIAYASNRAGGVEGGMSTGERMLVRAAMKPIATLMEPLPSVDLATGQAVRAHIERSDFCAVPAAAVIGEMLLALVLADAVLEKFGGDSMAELEPRVAAWRETVDAR